MKKVNLLKALVIIVPILIAIFAQYYETQQKAKVDAYYKGISQQKAVIQYVETLPGY